MRLFEKQKNETGHDVSVCLSENSQENCWKSGLEQGSPTEGI